MCGIVGYVGKRNSIDILLRTLKTLEYRGYDSSGVAYVKDNKIEIIKCVGKISNLLDKCDNEIDINLGIGHTRWATHGGVNLENCHPHRHGNITLVHNGIIENYLEIKNYLINLGYEFYGDTDSEVLCALIDYCYNMEEDIIDSLRMVIDKVKGSYAVCLIVDNDYSKIYVVKKDSPLIIGVLDDGNFVASDIPAIVKYTNKYILLDDYEIGIISFNNIEIYNNGILINKDIYEYDKDISGCDKNNFSHYMLKEIYDQPLIIKNNILDNLDGILDIKKYRKIYIVGCGSAYNAGLIGKYLIERYVDIQVDVSVASEFRYSKLFVGKDDLVIFISQSGETADTLACLKRIKEIGADTLAIVNVVDSSLARDADMVIYTNAGIEVAVATTKAYVMQIYMLGLIALKGSNIKYEDLIDYYKLLVLQIDKIINDDTIKGIALDIYNNDDIYFLGRGIDYYISLEGNLKLKEISYIHSETYPSGELKHGSIALIEEDTIVISIITDKNIKDKTLSNIKEVISRGAKSIIICSEDIDIDKSYYNYIYKVPRNIDVLMPILVVIPLQLMAYEVAKLRGYDIDKPRNLAKSVTVE